MIRQYWFLAAAALVLLSAWMWSCAMAGPNGLLEYRKKKVELQRLQAGVLQMQQENDQLERRIKGLRTDPRVIEDEARKQWYVRPGERVYILLEPRENGPAPQLLPGDSNASAQPGRGEQAESKEKRPPFTHIAVAMAIGAIIAGLGAYALRLRRRTSREPLA